MDGDANVYFYFEYIDFVYHIFESQMWICIWLKVCVIRRALCGSSPFMGDGND